MKFSNRGKIKREREVEKREEKGREGGRRKTKLRKEILNFRGRKNKSKLQEKIPNRYPNTRA